MKRTDGLAYRRETGYQALRVPYRAGLTAMCLGLDIFFDERRADFGGLLMPSPHRPPPCPPVSAGPREDCTLVRLSDATQNVYLDVDEEGTEAAAVTVLAFEVTTIGVSPPPLDFTVDRPFLLAIRDERTGTMLFVGYVADPRG